MTKNKPPYFFLPNAEDEKNGMWKYTRDTHGGEAVADKYVLDFHAHLATLHEIGKHRAVQKSRFYNVTQRELYYFHYKQKPKQKRGYSVFYDIADNGDLRIISILGDGMNKTAELTKALQHIEAETQKTAKKSEAKGEEILPPSRWPEAKRKAWEADQERKTKAGKEPDKEEHER